MVFDLNNYYFDVSRWGHSMGCMECEVSPVEGHSLKEDYDNLLKAYDDNELVFVSFCDDHGHPYKQLVTMILKDDDCLRVCLHPFAVITEQYGILRIDIYPDKDKIIVYKI